MNRTVGRFTQPGGDDQATSTASDNDIVVFRMNVLKIAFHMTARQVKE
jgi:hypothetical protein